MKPGYKKPHPLMQILLQGRAMGDPYVPFVAMGAVGKTRARSSTHWLTAYGVFMRPDQMTHEHKLNCIRMIANKRRTRAQMLQAAFSALQYAKDAPEGAADAASEEAADLIDAEYRDRVAFVMGHSPILAEMGRLLRVHGIDPYIDYGRELYDGEAPAPWIKGVREFKPARVIPIPRDAVTGYGNDEDMPDEMDLRGSPG